MKTTKLLKIQRHLAMGRSITPQSAAKLYDCYSLSQRIGDLIRKGFPIQSETARKAKFKKYWIDVERVSL